jgi:hypothetical protein
MLDGLWHLSRNATSGSMPQIKMPNGVCSIPHHIPKERDGDVLCLSVGKQRESGPLSLLKSPSALA